ncbi:CAP domain-containing protein [Nocardioides immobilis]|uniref:CAP domain-containing protein n=1 Tax=Nocardioides immobilis TaxID=2049295 RepID=A0A417Y1K4_9ACTN|nr:CAP domain-containing protein [Nocardioides immobilis]RHW26540.1 CAP domain-containing protein [Nocardioides immobilis]
MRITIAVLAALASSLLVAPAPTAAVAPSDDRTVQSERAAQVSPKAKVIALVNARRENRGCNPLRRNAALGRAAQKHSRRMGNAHTLSHDLPGEPSLGTRITRAGYRNWRRIGENIAYNYATPEAVVAGWMASRGHRRNILRCSFKHTGVGLVVDSHGHTWWTQTFGRR